MDISPVVKMKRTSRLQELEEAGWVKQFTADEPRLSEAIELYQLLGFEIHLEPMRPGEMEGPCQRCVLTQCGYQTIFTRKKKADQE